MGAHELSSKAPAVCRSRATFHSQTLPASSPSTTAPNGILTSTDQRLAATSTWPAASKAPFHSRLWTSP